MLVGAAENAVEGDIDIGIGARASHVTGTDIDLIVHLLVTRLGNRQEQVADAVLFLVQPLIAGKIPELVRAIQCNLDVLQIPAGIHAAVVVHDPHLGKLAQLFCPPDGEFIHLTGLEVILRIVQQMLRRKAQGSVQGKVYLRIGSGVLRIAGADIDPVDQLVRPSGSHRQGTLCDTVDLLLVQPLLTGEVPYLVCAVQGQLHIPEEPASLCQRIVVADVDGVHLAQLLGPVDPEFIGTVPLEHIFGIFRSEFLFQLDLMGGVPGTADGDVHLRIGSGEGCIAGADTQTI